jgi:flagellin
VYGDTNLTAVSGDNLEPATNFTIVTNDALLDASSTAVVEKVYSQAGNTSHINAGAVTSAVNASLLFEVVGIDGTSVRVRVIGDQLATDGTHTAIDQVVALTANGSTTLTGPTAIGGINSLALSLGTADKFEVGDKFTMYVQAAAAAGDDGITVTRQYRDANDELITGTSVSRQVVLADGTAPDITYTAYEMDATSGTVKATKLFLTGTAVSTSTYSCTFNTTDGNAVLYKRGTKVGDVALAETRLYDIEQFWDSNGNFILENPKTITLVQGTGAKAQVIITSADTIQTVQDKINEAIRTAEPKGLGQGALVGGPPLDDNFVSYVTDPPDATGYETVPGTFIIRSAMPGSDGEIDFVGDDSIINALG